MIQQGTEHDGSHSQDPVGTTEMEVPKFDGGIAGVDTDFDDWFANMKEKAMLYECHWKQLKFVCDEARANYREIVCPESPEAETI